ncbi:hypothetical protein [Pendulispora albinea]|uniref:Uncharacterized protein n=1 Tax=Pendulispora albinea TaxID=2741071 RepID=A0ABZ2M3V0_9BACT
MGLIAVGACGGDTFTNDPALGGDGGGDAGAAGDARGTGDARDEGCAPGLSKGAFCSNFDDPTMQFQRDGWTGYYQPPQSTPSLTVSRATTTGATSGANVLFVANNDAQGAYVWIKRPNKPKHVRFAFDLRSLILGSRPLVPAGVAICASRDSSNCYVLQLRFGTGSDRLKPVFFEERSDTGSAQRQLPGVDTGVIEGTWSRVVLEAHLEGDAKVLVTFGSKHTFGIRPPSDIVDRIDHVELSLGAVEASPNDDYRLLYDTVTFDPEPL